MFQAFIFMFEGAPAWDRLALQNPGLARVFFLRLVPMMVITAGLEGWGLVHWGKWQPAFHDNRAFSLNHAIAYEIIQSVLNLVMILISAKLLQVMGRTHHCRETYTYLRSLTVVVCSLSPLFLLRLLDVFPAMSPYIPWAIGIVLSIWVLYDGLPRFLLPDPTHAFGLFLSSAFMLLLATCLVRVITAMYLEGNAGFAHSFLGRSIIDLIGN